MCPLILKLRRIMLSVFCDNFSQVFVFVRGGKICGVSRFCNFILGADIYHTCGRDPKFVTFKGPSPFTPLSIIPKVRPHLSFVIQNQK